MGSEISGAAADSVGYRSARSGECSSADGPDQGADTQRAAVVTVLLEDVESADVVDVHQQGRRGEPELHERNQALATGQYLRIVTVLGQQGQRIVKQPRGGVLETGWKHEPPPRIAQPTLGSGSASG